MATPPTETEIPLGFGGSTAAVGDHIAHFYRGEAEMFSVLGPYIAAGLERDERCAVICSPDSAVNFRAWLDARGLDAIRSHPLCIMGEVLVHNALHTDPTELLEELAERI